MNLQYFKDYINSLFMLRNIQLIQPLFTLKSSWLRPKSWM